MQRKSSARQKAVTDVQRGVQTVARTAEAQRAGTHALARTAEAPRAAAQATARAVAPSPRNLPEIIKVPLVQPSSQRGSGETTLGGHVDRGLTLAALYDTGVLERLRLEVRVRLIADLTQSLAWLHANPRLMAAHPHLVIAPSTVVIGLDGVARVDVRAAKKQESERNPLELDYAAPEVINEDPAADLRADIFSIGVLAWEALAGRRIGSAEVAPLLPASLDEGGDVAELPPALGGSTEREPLRRHVVLRSAPKSSHSRLRLPPALTLAEDADWALPLAELVMLAMSADPAQRPPDCRALIAALELASVRLASPQEIAEVVQGISAVATLCIPEPTLPDVDSSCQSSGQLGFMDREPCSAPTECCAQRQAQVARRIVEAPAPSKRIIAAPAFGAPAVPASKTAVHQLGSAPSRRAWFAAGLAWLAVLGLLAGFAASFFGHR
jgi:protein tyrosine kinase